MHALLTAFFAMLFSFSHAQTARPGELASASDSHPYLQAPMPSREELNYEQFQTATSYAVDSCVSCRRMNVDYNAR